MSKEVIAELAGEYAKKGNLSVKSFIAWGGIGRTKFYEEVKAGRIKLRKIGTKSVVTMPDALAWLNALPEANSLQAVEHQST